MLKQRSCRYYVISTISAIMTLVSVSAAAGGNAVESPWHISATAGRLDFEGDQAVYDTFLPCIHLGYDLNDRWTVEGSLGMAPDINENFRVSYGQRISRLAESTKDGVNDTRSARIAVEGLYHFARTKMIDPYLAVGGGLAWYSDDFDSQYDPEVRVGAGMLWHLNSQWAIRTDARIILAGISDPEFNSIVSAGLTWTIPSGRSPGRSSVSPEVPPVAPPAVQPVAVPAEKAENVKKYELHIEFAENSSEITAQYFGELDVIGKELRDQPGAKAKIEAHTDQRKNSIEKDAVKLTEKRAKAVQDYLSSRWKIRKNRTEAVGYGFSKPKEKADLDNGNLANRRIEISIILPADKK